MTTSDLSDAAPLDEQDCPEGHDLADSAADSPCFGKAAGRPRAADKVARREALLHTAGRLFLEKGYSKVSLEMIAREAHVAVRTIYVKFGGKAGLLNAIIANGRAHHMSGMASMDTDPRPMEEILQDFSLRFLELVSLPTFINLHRMVVAEARSTPELGETFFKAGPQQTRDQLGRFFARPDIKVQLREGLRAEMVPVFLINCLMGDYMSHLLYPREARMPAEELQRRAAEGLDLFLHAVRR